MSSSNIYLHIISRHIARELGMQRYFTGKSCKHGHISDRRTSDRGCLECSRIKERSKKTIERKSRWCQNNRDYLVKYKADWYSDHRDEMREKSKDVYRKNRHKYIYRARARQNMIGSRTLGYEDEIKEIYLNASDLRENGQRVHVDHIIPLQGELISGLHVPWNLQVISEEENRKKGNSFYPYIEIYDITGNVIKTEIVEEWVK